MTEQTMIKVLDHYDSIAIKNNSPELAIKLNWVRNSLQSGGITRDDAFERVLQLAMLNK